MHGFCITITQVLDYRPKAKAYKFLSYKKPKLLQCPKMAHSLKITFNDLEDFNTNFAKLNQESYSNSRDDLNIKIGSNELEKSNFNTEYFQQFDGSIERSFKPKW